jgi:hypothetical protein
MSEQTDVVDSLVLTREALLREADAVPPELRETPFVGHWNLMDVLAHLVGWDYTNQRAIEEFRQGQTPDFYRHYDAGWASYNQQLIDHYGSSDWVALRSALDKSQASVVAVLRSLGAEELTQELSRPGRRRPVTIEGILRAAVGDEREHLEQIRSFVAGQPLR